MHEQKFKRLDNKSKRDYLLKLFLNIKNIYPIYNKIYNFLSKKRILDNVLLEKLNNAVENIGKKTEIEGKRQIEIKQKQLQKIEEIDKKNIKKELQEIENHFI